jgi:hypothetical protein
MPFGTIAATELFKAIFAVAIFLAFAGWPGSRNWNLTDVWWRRIRPRLHARTCAIQPPYASFQPKFLPFVVVRMIRHAKW